MNALLANKRSNPSFDVEELTCWLDGGYEYTLRRRSITTSMEEYLGKSLLEDGMLYDRREEKMRRVLERTVKMVHLEKTLCLENTLIDKQTLHQSSGDYISTLLHPLMFIPTIKVREIGDEMMVEMMVDGQIISSFSFLFVGII